MKKNKIIALLCTISVLCALLTVGVSAGASVPKVEISLPNPVVGTPVPDKVTILSSGYYVAAVSWEPETKTFEEGKSYSMRVDVETTEGYAFDSNTVFTINGNAATILGRGSDNAAFAYTFGKPRPLNYITASYNTNCLELAPGEYGSLNVTTELNEISEMYAEAASYQWYRFTDNFGDAVPIPGAKEPIYTIRGEDLSEKAYYYCRVQLDLVSGHLDSNENEIVRYVTVSSKDQGVPFADVAPNDWFYRGVEFCYNHNLMDGVGHGMFNPGTTTSRAMIVTILYRMDDYPMTGYIENPFTDVPEGKWYTEAVLWAADMGIVQGYGNDKFGPNDPITREQFAAIAERYARYKGLYEEDDCVMLAGFMDSQNVSAWASDAMSWAVGTGLIGGKETRTGLFLDPHGSATRAQAATIIMRLMENLLAE